MAADLPQRQVQFQSSSKMKNLQELHQVGEAFHRIVVIRRARRESHVEIHAIGGSHGCGSSIEIDGFAFGCRGTIEDGLSKRLSEAEATAGGAYPKAFHLPRIGIHL